MHVLPVVLLCHFLSAFSVLGMPLFIPRVLEQLDAGNSAALAGLLFAIPGVCTALTAGAWGRFADRYGRRTSLLRAQLGLAVGFLLCGFAESVAVFSCGLLVQGLCGGTLAASNAYLASRQQGERLARSLNLTQLSARLALISGPVAIGALVTVAEPLWIYRFLALLPLLAVVATWRLPADRVGRAGAAQAQTGTGRCGGRARFPALLFTLQFLFCFSMVVTYPYFLPYAEEFRFSSTAVGLLYSLPHLVYVVLALPLGKLPWSPWARASVGLALLGLSGAGHYLLDGGSPAAPWQLLVLRLLFGLGITLTYLGLNKLWAQRATDPHTGRLFGLCDAAGKWGGVAAGLAAAAVAQASGPGLPFLLTLIAAALAAATISFRFKRELIHATVEPG